MSPTQVQEPILELRLPFAALLGHQQRAGSEMEKPGLALHADVREQHCKQWLTTLYHDARSIYITRSSVSSFFRLAECFHSSSIW